jgi:hypothetical protein
MQHGYYVSTFNNSLITDTSTAIALQILPQKSSRRLSTVLKAMKAQLLCTPSPGKVRKIGIYVRFIWQISYHRSKEAQYALEKCFLYVLPGELHACRGPRSASNGSMAYKLPS